MNRLIPLRRTQSSQITASTWKAYAYYFDFRSELREVIVSADQSISKVTALASATVNRDSVLEMSELTYQVRIRASIQLILVRTHVHIRNSLLDMFTTPLKFGRKSQAHLLKTFSQKQEVSSSFIKDHTESYYTSSLPSSVYLDRGASLAFSLVLSVSSSVTDLSSIGMSFSLGSPDYVHLTSTKTYDYASWKIIYNVFGN